MVPKLAEIRMEGKKILLRYPKISDAEELNKFINKAIKEGLRIGGTLGTIRHITLKSEKEWLKGTIRKIKKKNAVYMVLEYKSRIIGACDVIRDVHDATSHMGIFGIVLLEKWTGRGLGRQLAEIVINISKKKLKTEIIKLSVFENNKRAYNFYKKMGFSEVGRVKKGIKINKKYQDDIIMVKRL